MQRAYGLQVPQNLQEACDPHRLALIVYDMQVGILNQIRDGAAVTANVAKVIQAARDAGVRILYSRHMPLPKKLMGVFCSPRSYKCVLSRTNCSSWLLSLTGSVRFPEQS